MLCVNSHRLVSKTLLFLYELRVVKHSTNALCTYILLLLYKLRAVKHTTNSSNASQVRGRDGSAAMLVAKRSAGITPEVNLREHVT